MSSYRPSLLSRATGFLVVLTLASYPGAIGQELPASTPTTAATPAGAGVSNSGSPYGQSFPHLLVVDVRDILGAPLSWKAPQWGRFSLAVAGVGAAALLDRSVRDAERRNHNHFADQIAKGFEPLGGAGAFGVLGAFYLDGLVRGDSRAREVAEDGVVASLIAGGVIAPVLKLAVGRSRPRDTNKTFDRGGGSSFPSGHTTEAFAVASVIASHYDAPWIKYVSYGSATLVAYARIHHQAHFLSDVTAGALIGTVTGLAVVHRNDEERRRFAFTPILGPHDKPGMAVSFSF
jgi:hypothetical protein